MAKEVREIIAFDEQRAAEAGDAAAIAGLSSLQAQVDFAKRKGWLSARRPKDSLVATVRSEAPTPPDVLLQVQERLTQEGFSFDLIKYPRKRLARNSRFWTEKVAPEPWFWDQIKQGGIAKSAANLYGNWALIEAVQKPNYAGGKQMYYDGNDPLSSYLEQLRRDGKIEITDWTRNIPQNSRFGLSGREIEGLVVPRVQGILGAQLQVSLPREIEFNVAGNTLHPEWGQTNTWEWLADKFVDSYRLVGGHSDFGGLALVSADDSGYHYDHSGFRLQVVPSPKA